MTRARPRVFIAAAVRMYEEGLAAVIGDDSRFELVGTASTRYAMLDAIERLERPPDVGVIDLGRAEGIAAVEAESRGVEGRCNSEAARRKCQAADRSRLW